MKLVKAPDDEGSLFKRLVSEDGLVEMGIYPVLFGYRIRAGYVGSMSYHLDWCAGDNISHITSLYAMCQAILEKRDSSDAFKGLPTCSDIKPFYKDPKFTALIDDISGHVTKFPEITDRELIKMKQDSINYAISLTR